MTAAAAPGTDRIDPTVLKRALILIVGFIAVIFDTTIVSVALHTLAAQLHAPVPTIQWVTTGYLLALGIAVPLSTWGLRRFGGKRLWMAALAVFLIGSIGSSLAWNIDSLIAWRVVQGAGGGIMFPLLTTLIMQAAGGKALGRTITVVAIPVMAVAFLGLDKEQIAHSSVVTRMVQQIGGSFGTAILAVILSAAIAAHHGDLATGFHLAFWWATGFSVVAVLLSLWLPSAPRKQAAPGPSAAPSASAAPASSAANATHESVRENQLLPRYRDRRVS
jgi:MFS family permease